MFDFKTVSIDSYNIKIMQSDIFSNGLAHFFSTRLGGDTPNPLNTFTLSAKDYMQYNDFAIKNQKLACKILGGNYDNFIMPNQQHTDKIAVIKQKEDIKKIYNEPFDGIITNLKKFPICLVFADCTPIILYDEENKVVACIHAGWKGTAMRIAKKAVNLMVKEFHSAPSTIQVAMGATICKKCFEINRDIAGKLAMSINKSYDNIFLETSDKIYADLKLINKMQLKEVGIEKIDICSYCTSCDNDIFYSYRADDKCTGRHGMLAMLEE